MKTSKRLRFFGYLFLASTFASIALGKDASTLIICGVILAVGSKLAALLEALESGEARE